jgi:hypothetical protein
MKPSVGNSNSLQIKTSDQLSTSLAPQLAPEPGKVADLDLARLVEAWPKLRESVRAAIMAILKECTQQKGPNL